MDDVQLPENTRTAFGGLAKAVLSAFPEGTVALGGGTLLAALWGHRTSTDLDLFVAPANLEKAHRMAAPQRLGAILNQALRKADIELASRFVILEKRAVFLRGTCGDGTPWSLADMAYMDPNLPMRQSVEGTGIRAAGITEVLMGKIAGRALNADHRNPEAGEGKEPIPIRDCYDICICAALQPRILVGVIDALPSSARERIARNFRDAPRDLHLRDPKPIIDPAWSIELEGVAAKIGDAVAAGHLGAIPVAQPNDRLPDPPSCRAGSSKGEGLAP